jgi:hypothetical protein
MEILQPTNYAHSTWFTNEIRPDHFCTDFFQQIIKIVVTITGSLIDLCRLLWIFFPDSLFCLYNFLFVTPPTIRQSTPTLRLHLQKCKTDSPTDSLTISQITERLSESKINSILQASDTNDLYSCKEANKTPHKPCLDDFKVSLSSSSMKKNSLNSSQLISRTNDEYEIPKRLFQQILKKTTKNSLLKSFAQYFSEEDIILGIITCQNLYSQFMANSKNFCSQKIEFDTQQLIDEWKIYCSAFDSYKKILDSLSTVNIDNVGEQIQQTLKFLPNKDLSHKIYVDISLTNEKDNRFALLTFDIFLKNAFIFSFALSFFIINRTPKIFSYVISEEHKTHDDYAYRPKKNCLKNWQDGSSSLIYIEKPTSIFK